MREQSTEKFDFCRGRWGMTQAEVMTSELGEWTHSDPSELYYNRDLLGYPAQTKYCFSPSGRLWLGIYRIAADDGHARLEAFNALRSGNLRGYGMPSAVIRREPDGGHSYLDVVEAVSEGDVTWPGEWHWRFTTVKVWLALFELGGKPEVWLHYASNEMIEALRSGQFPTDGPYVRSSALGSFGRNNHLLA